MNDTLTQLLPALSAIALMTLPTSVLWLGALGEYLQPLWA